jgi:hypothetical protein
LWLNDRSSSRAVLPATLSCKLGKLAPLRGEAEPRFAVQRTSGSFRFSPAIVGFLPTLKCKFLVHHRVTREQRFGYRNRL